MQAVAMSTNYGSNGLLLARLKNRTRINLLCTLYELIKQLLEIKISRDSTSKMSLMVYTQGTKSQRQRSVKHI